jgi:hypothetical protein
MQKCKFLSLVHRIEQDRVSEQISVGTHHALKVKFYVPPSSGEFLPQIACDFAL